METAPVSFIDGEAGTKRRVSAEEFTSNKKLAVSSASGSPTPANGILDTTSKGSSNDPESEADLERFRKAAVYRRMLAYRRGKAQAEQRIAELEALLKQANLKRYEADTCWTSTMSTIRRLTPLAALEKEVGPSLKTVFPNKSEVFTSDDFESAGLPSERIEAAERVIRAFLTLAGKVERPDYQELFSECQGLQQTNEFLQAQLDQTRIHLRSAERDRDAYLTELNTAQSRIDRLQSRILHPSLKSEASTDSKSTLNGAKESSPSRSSTPHVKVENDRSDAQTTIQQSLPGDAPSASASDPNFEVENLRLENQRLLDRVSELRAKLEREEAKVASPDIDLVVKLPIYKVAFDQAVRSEAKFKQCYTDLSSVRERCSFLQASRVEWEKATQDAVSKVMVDSQESIRKRDEELLRLKSQRDDFDAEKRSLKELLEAKWSHATKMQELASTRAEQVAFLTSENRRLKARLAAASGDEDLYAFLTKNGDANTDYVQDLQRRLRDAEGALERTQKGSSSSDMPRLLKELESSKRELASLKSSLDPMSHANLQEELQRLKLVETQNSEEIQALYQEVENMGLSLEESAKKIEEQVITLEKWEEERDRLIGARTRADTKYFKTCSELEAKDSEKRLLTREFEKHIEHVKKLQEANTAQSHAITSLEREVHHLQDEKATTQNRIHSLEQERDASLGTARMKTMALETVTEKLQRLSAEAERNASQGQMARREIDVLKEKIAKLDERIQSSGKMPLSGFDDNEVKEYARLKKLLKCSTCETGLRNTIISKCMHTFCKQCIDERITSRNRKCPYCTVLFGKEDVQTIYYQG